MATQNTTTTGGYITLSLNASLYSWSDLRNASTGDAAQANPTTTSVNASYSTAFRGGLFTIVRTYLAFDLSGVTGTITDLDLVLTANAGGTNDIIVCKSSAPGIATNLTTADFGDVDFNTSYSSEYTTWTTGTNTIGLNSTAISDANSNGFLILAVIDHDYDYQNIAPGLEYLGHPIQYSSGTAPYLSYTALTGYGNTVIGVVSANIGEVNGVATADIDTVIGV